MLGLRFIKTQPTQYVIAFRAGRAYREGAGLAFFYFAPTASLVAATARRATASRSATGRSSNHRAASSSRPVSAPPGWLKSIYAGWVAATRALARLPLDRPPSGTFPWDADFLHHFVRGPFPSRTTGAGIVIGRIAGATPMRLLSQMPENGVIFSDGIEADFLELDSGTEALIGLARQRGRLVT